MEATTFNPAPPDIHPRQAARRVRLSGLLLWGMAILAAVLVLLPIAYLVLRVAGAEQSLVQLLWRVSLAETLARTVALAAAVTLLANLIALPLAWLTVRSDIPWRRLWTVIAPLPLVIPSYVGAYLFVSALGPRGMLQQGLESVAGIQRLPDIYGFTGALIVLTLVTYPYIYLSARAALQRMDPAIEEASRSLGQSAWMTFWRVTLPQLRPALMAGSLLVALYVLRDFGAVSILRYNTFTRVIYIQYQSAFDRTAAALFSLVLVAMTIIVLALEMRSRGRARYHRSAARAVRPPTIVKLGRWRWPALAFFTAILALALLLPAGILGYWLVRGIRAGEQIGSLGPALGNSLLAAGLAAGVVLIFALPIATLDVRWPSRWSHLIERISYLGFALPGVVIALALVFFGANYLGPLYQTLPLLIVAYLVLFLPLATGTIRTALLQVHPRLEESARSLGKRPAQVFTTITLPLIRPGLAAALSLVFLTTMKELPATLILGPYGFKTLATTVWSSVSEAFFARAAAPALLLILVSSISMLLILREQNRHYD